MNNGGNTLCNSEIEYLGQEEGRERGRGEENLKQNRIVSPTWMLAERRQG